MVKNKQITRKVKFKTKNTASKKPKNMFKIILSLISSFLF